MPCASSCESVVSLSLAGAEPRGRLDFDGDGGDEEDEVEHRLLMGAVGGVGVDGERRTG